MRYDLFLDVCSLFLHFYPYFLIFIVITSLISTVHLFISSAVNHHNFHSSSKYIFSEEDIYSSDSKE